MSQWAVRRPIWALVTWFLLVIAIGGAANALNSKWNNSFALPGVQSTQAQDLLEKLPAASSDTTSVTVVWRATDGTATDNGTREHIDPLLKELATLPSVQCVTTPFGENLGRACPKATTQSLEQVVEQQVTAQVSKATGLSSEDLQDVGRLMPQLVDLERVDPTTLGTVAAALPGIAKLALAPKAVLDGLATITPADLQSIGVTPADTQAITAAFGGLDKVAGLPRTTLADLAKADPAKLKVAAERIPAQVSALEKDWTAFQTELARLKKAARATSEATSTVSRNDRIAYATVTIDGTTLPAAEANRVYDLIVQAESEGLTVGAQGGVLESAGPGGGVDSELVGIIAAIVILLIAFGSLIASGLPIIVAGMGLAGGLSLVSVARAFVGIPEIAPTLATMIGLGVGIDYALFILNRYRQGLQEGHDPKDAALVAVRTAGRAVAFAGVTVIIALLGMFVFGIDFFNGLSIAAAAGVLMVMLSALIFLPALLSLLGTKAIGLRMPWARRLRPFDPQASRWSGYARLLQRAPAIPVVIVLAVIGVAAWPATSLQLGFPDDGTEAAGTPLRTGFDLMAEGFGDGVNGPFFVAVQTKKKDDFAGLTEAVKALEQTDGVARTLPTAGMMPLVEFDKSIFGDGGTVASVLVYPSTSPQSEATDATLERIRETTAPRLADEHDVAIYVGGTQAVTTDFTMRMSQVLALFLLLVVGFGFIALALLFRSLVIPLTAAITSLLSFAAALGITVAVFQHGLLAAPLQVTGTGPILPFLPVMLFAILFGLSMDYQVFLVTRMQEAWHQTGDNRESVRLGLAGSGRVVVIAASIMTCVFLAFVPTPADTVKVFGVAFASAVVIDAFLIRLVLVPSLMTLLGRANWWLPKWLARIMPRITLE